MIANPRKRRPGATGRARALRANETEAEYRLWGDIRNRQLNGYKFARQIPIGPYVVDFICRDARLVLELDGVQHSEDRRDDIRTRFLNRNGYSVLRFWNDEVLRERGAVLDTLLAVLDGQIFANTPGLRFSPASSQSEGNRDEQFGGRVS